MDWIQHLITAQNLAELIALVILAIIAHAVKTPKDAERAVLLTTLAESAAAVAVNYAPNDSWSSLLAEVVRRIKDESTLPTTNHTKIENAATAALTKLGRSAVSP